MYIHVHVSYVLCISHITNTSTDSLQCEMGVTEGVVLMLVDPIAGLGHHLYTDNLYTSPQLYAELRRRGFEACGTMRLNRRGVPPEAKSSSPKGERRAVCIDDNLRVVQWHDKRTVSILSTLQSDSTVTIERRSRHAPGGREEVEKPEAVVEYNKYMAGVDLGDQLLSYYGFPHRTVKWWRRAFFFLFDAAIVNSYIMYCLSVTGRRLSQEQFRSALAKQLLSSASTPEATPHTSRHQAVQTLARLTERRPTSLLEPSCSETVQSAAIRRGEGGKRQHSCVNNAIYYCVVPCFELHHTKVDPQRYL